MYLIFLLASLAISIGLQMVLPFPYGLGAALAIFIALFIGLAVSIGSVVMGLLYSGFKGKKTDETMMRLNDVIYALPALPFLIILAVTVGNSIFLIIGFLMIFGWVGIAKVSRSMALQIFTNDGTKKF